MLSRLKDQAKNLICKHGSEVGLIAKVTAHALLPTLPALAESVGAVCDYIANKGQDLTDEQLNHEIQHLGGDVTYLEQMFDTLDAQLHTLLSQMSMMNAMGANEDMLMGLVHGALETQFHHIRDAFRDITPQLETVKQQGERLLQEQSLQGEILRQVQDQLHAALAFSVPLAEEGVDEAFVIPFLLSRAHFQNALLMGHWSQAQQSLAKMKDIAPHANTVRISEMAFYSTQKDFIKAERIARTFVGIGADHPRVKQAKQSLTRLTHSLASHSTPPVFEAMIHSPQYSPQYASSTHEPSHTLSYSQPTTSSSLRDQMGTCIGDKAWQLQSLLGRGGMGSVWRVTNRFGQVGALKLMNPQLGGDIHFEKRFQAEIKALNRVQHSAVIEILDWGQDHSGTWYFVMPFIEGATLRSRLMTGYMDQNEVKQLACCLASALVECHKQSVIHRDIKPDNIMFKLDGAPVLIDFGIAHQTGMGTGQTIMATGGYAPPELLAGRPIDASVDLFALGMTLAECLGPCAGELQWADLINELTHFIPQRRGSAQNLLNRLLQVQQHYYASIIDGETLGPWNIEQTIHYIQSCEQAVYLWWEGADDWVEWDQVDAIFEQVIQSTPITPPPLKVNPIHLNEDDAKISSKKRMNKGDQNDRIDQGTKMSRPNRVDRKILGNLIDSADQGMQVSQAHQAEQTNQAEQTVQATRIDKAGHVQSLKTKDGIACSIKGVSFEEKLIPAPKGGEAFLMMRTPVTQALYRVVTGMTPSHFTGDHRPVESVSWWDVVTFCNALSEYLGLIPAYHVTYTHCRWMRQANGFRIPFEKEWQWAAQGGKNFLYAGSSKLSQVGWYSDNSSKRTHSVARKKPNGYGLYDISGNVWEWCMDDYQNPGHYNSESAERTLRGGAWLNQASVCHLDYRLGHDPHYKEDHIGFRLVRLKSSAHA